MQSVASRIWTRVAVFISYDDNHYTTGTSTTPRAPPLHPAKVFHVECPLQRTQERAVLAAYKVLFGLWLPKRARKIVLDRKKEPMCSAPDWSLCGRIAWRWHWLARGNRSVTATPSLRILHHSMSSYATIHLNTLMVITLLWWLVVNQNRISEQ